MTQAVLGVVCALRSEARHLGRTLSKDPHVEAFADGRLLALTGMGPAAAAAGTAHLLSCGATALMSFGLAGALDPSLSPGTIFLPQAVADGEGCVLESDGPWRERLLAALNITPYAARGVLLTMPHAIAAVAAKAALYAATGSRAVDMESFGVARVACEAGLPFVAVRVIIDGATDALPAAVLAATDSAGRTSIWRLLKGLTQHPAQIAPLLRLARSYRHASRQLGTLARTAVRDSLASGPS